MATSLFEECAIIKENTQLGHNVYKMELSCADIGINALPGQFVMLKSKEECAPLLRRPFSIHDVINQNIKILYKVVGQGTRLMAGLKKGDEMMVLGPIGKGFSLPDKGLCFLVGGGIGVAPLVFLGRRLAGNSDISCVVLLGGRGKSDILCKDEFKAMGVEIKIITEDGSLDRKGLVTELLAEAFAENRVNNVFTCGPHAMLRAVGNMAVKKEIPCQLSLESVMACGMGACLGCRVEGGPKGHIHVCKDGPVVEAKDFLGQMF